MHLISFKIVVAFFLAAFVTGALSCLFRSPKRFRAGLAALAGGWVVLGVLLFSIWRASGHLPLSNQYESLLFLIWSVVTVYFVFLAMSFDFCEGLSPWVSVCSLVGLGVASLLNSSVEPLVPALQSNWLLIHVTTTMLGYAAFALAFVGGVMLLVKLKLSKGSYDETALDLFLFRACALGFWLLTLGIITGAVWANSAWGSYWSWDPKETWALITWLYYATALHLRRTHKWEDKRFGWLMVLGMAFVLFTYFGVNYLLSGLHSYA